MKKEQIDLMVEKQKAIENRETVYYKLSTMLKDAKDNGYRCMAHDITLIDSVKLSVISSKEEFVEQLEFLVAYHKMKLDEQKKEMETYILSRTIE